MLKNESYKRLEQERPEAIKAGIIFGGQIIPLIDMDDSAALSIVTGGAGGSEKNSVKKSVLMAGGVA